MQDAEDRRIGRLIASFALTGFATAMIARITDPLVVEIGAEFSVHPGTVALLASLYALMFALVQPFLGPVGDALGKRRVILVAQLVFAVLILGCAVAPDFGSLAWLRAASGAAGGGIFPLALAVFGDEVPLAKRQVAVGRFMLFSIMGGITGGVLAAVLEPWLGWRGVLAFGGASAVAAWLVLLLSPRPREGMRPLRVADALARYGRLLRMPMARLLYGSVALNSALAIGLAPHLAPLLQGYGMDGTAASGLVLAAFGLGGLVYTLVVGRLLARMGQTGLLRLGGGIACCGLALLAATSSLPPLLLSGLLLGCGYMMIHGTIQVRASELAPDARGAAMALHAFSFFIGQFIGPVVYGWAIPAVGTIVFLFAGVALAWLGWWMARAR
ncbi:MAG: MFS transporter [Alphaproteobacteria bacterium]|nr:MFS transporter [Alphaproteobacteria bacterium]